MIKKYLIKLPLNQEAEKIILDNSDIKVNFTETFLKQNDNCNTCAKSIVVEMWGKQLIPHFSFEKSSLKEDNQLDIDVDLLSANEYQTLINSADPAKVKLEGNRYIIGWKDNLFNLYLYSGSHPGLAILEFDKNNINEKDELPPYLEVERDVSNDKDYLSINFADKSTLDKCAGEWMSGSGGHRKHFPCGKMATWAHVDCCYAYCDEHIVEHEKKYLIYYPNGVQFDFY